MSELVLKDYIDNMNRLSGRDLLMFIVVHNVAPVLAGIKPAVILTFSENNKSLFTLWIKYRDYAKLNINLKIYELKRKDDSIVVMFYDKDSLLKVVNKEENKIFLKKVGYSSSLRLQEKMELLGKRFGNTCPHEIGIFLGYPLNDVRVFMECPNKKCLLCGYWKVYHEPEKALKIFESYNKVKDKVISSFSCGCAVKDIIEDLRYEANFF